MATVLTRTQLLEQRRALTKRDARVRAYRTFIHGLMIDVLLAVLITLQTALIAPEFAWSATYWQLMGLGVAKTVLISMISYVMRFMSPPPDTP